MGWSAPAGSPAKKAVLEAKKAVEAARHQHDVAKSEEKASRTADATADGAAAGGGGVSSSSMASALTTKVGTSEGERGMGGVTSRLLSKAAAEAAEINLAKEAEARTVLAREARAKEEARREFRRKSEALRVPPLGRDRHGSRYWMLAEPFAAEDESSSGDEDTGDKEGRPTHCAGPAARLLVESADGCSWGEVRSVSDLREALSESADPSEHRLAAELKERQEESLPKMVPSPPLHQPTSTSGKELPAGFSDVGHRWIGRHLRIISESGWDDARVVAWRGSKPVGTLDGIGEIDDDEASVEASSVASGEAASIESGEGEVELHGSTGAAAKAKKRKSGTEPPRTTFFYTCGGEQISAEQVAWARLRVRLMVRVRAAATATARAEARVKTGSSSRRSRSPSSKLLAYPLLVLAIALVTLDPKS